MTSPYKTGWLKRRYTFEKMGLTSLRQDLTPRVQRRKLERAKQKIR